MKKTCLLHALFLLSLGAPAQTAQTTALSFVNNPANRMNYTPQPAFALPGNGSEFEDYGGKLGIGISILNGFGVPVRYYINHKNVLEAGMYSGGVLIYNSSDQEFKAVKFGFMGGLGYTHFGNRFLKERKLHNKVRAHGIALRFSKLFGDFNTTFASLGWAVETFREGRTNRSFIFELGLQADFPDFVYEGFLYNDPQPGVYLRCHWNFFVD